MAQYGVAVPRTPIGIDGLDTMIGGGILKNRVILVVGGPGTGKTTLSIQYLVNGALQFMERGLYVSLSESHSRDKIFEEAGIYGLDFEDLHREGKIDFLDFSSKQKRARLSTDGVNKRNLPIAKLIESIKYSALEVKAQRIAVDSLATFSLYFGNEARNNAVLDLFEVLEETEATSIVTDEVRGSSQRKVLLEEYLADGVIVLQSSQVERGRVRTIEVEKMRGTPIDDQIRPYIIGDNGLEVISERDIFSFAAELLTKKKV